MRIRLIPRLLALATLAVPLALPGPHPSGRHQPAVPLSSVLPAPVEVRPAAGQFLLTPDTVVRSSFDSRKIASQFAASVNPATGFHLSLAPGSPQPNDGKLIYLREDARDPTLGTEGYRLEISRRAITVWANRPAGVYHGVQTLLQLLPTDIDSPTVKRHAWPVAAGAIVDYPRYAYRGAMLDEARHFFAVPDVERYLDEIARFKINYLHLHLADDQGWRIEINGWPRLTAVSGASGTGVDGVGGGYLTQADYRTLVAYAAARYITIVPEIDMPGHVNAAEVAYPELTCDGQAPPPRTDTEVGYSSLCVGKDVTYRFAEDVIEQLAALTPGPYLHIGGDEAQATSPDDYLTFENRVLPLVVKYGKIAYGWHQITQSPAATSAVAQFWGTGPTDPTLPAAAQAGTKVVMSPANQAYLDQKYNEHTRLGQDWAGLIEVDTAYNWDPATRVTGVPTDAVIGVEAPLWSETLRSIGDIEYMAFPRLPALAELGWSPAATHNWPSFRARLGQYGTRWHYQGVNFYHSREIRWS